MESQNFIFKQSRGGDIREKLIQPLHADVLMALTQATRSPCQTAACEKQRSRVDADAIAIARHNFKELEPIAALTLQRTPSTYEMLRTFERTAHWPAVMNALAWARCKRIPGWGELPKATAYSPGPYLCARLPDFGNTYLGPLLFHGVRRRRDGESNNFVGAASHVLQQLHSLGGCLRLLRKHEHTLGREYDRVVHSRLDYVWLMPHPPLQALDIGYLWTPDGETYGGFCDRHAVMRRTLADVYFGRYQMIEDGRILQVDPWLASSASASASAGSSHRSSASTSPSAHGMSSERLLLHVINYYNMSVTVHRIPTPPTCTG